MKPFRTIWRVLTIHCDEASRLSSESLDHELTTGDQLACRLHLLICGDCRSHRRDILELRRIGRHLAEPVENPATTLPDEARERIKRVLQNETTKG